MYNQSTINKMHMHHICKHPIANDMTQTSVAFKTTAVFSVLPISQCSYLCVEDLTPYANRAADCEMENHKQI